MVSPLQWIQSFREEDKYVSSGRGIGGEQSKKKKNEHLFKDLLSDSGSDRREGHGGDERGRGVEEKYTL